MRGERGARGTHGRPAARFLLALFLVGASPLGRAAARQEPPTPVEREFRVRAWALRPDQHVDAMVRALSSEEWTDRASAFEALRRALFVGTLDADAAWLAACDPVLLRSAEQPGFERAQALGLLACWPRPLELSPAAIESALAGPPAVQGALAAALERLTGPAADEALLRCLAHDDPAVRDAAATALLERSGADRPDRDPSGPQRQAWSRAAVGALAQALARSPDEPGADAPQSLAAAWARELTRFERRAPDVEALDELARQARAAPEPARQVQSELVAALALRLLGRGDVELVAQAFADERLSDLYSRSLLVGAARTARAQGPGSAVPRDLAQALARRAHAGAAEATVSGLVECCEPDLWSSLLEPPGSVSEEACALAFELLAQSEGAWSAARAAPWLAPRPAADATRAAALSALIAAPDPSDDQARVALIVAAMVDPAPGLNEIAMRALARAEHPPRTLYDVWRARPEDERARLLRWMPRGAAGAHLRDDLIELGGRRADLRAPCAEALCTLADDERAHDALCAWLEADLQRLSESPEVDPALQARAISLTRARARLPRSDVTAALLEIAERTARADLQVAKVALALAAEQLGNRSADEAVVALLPWTAAGRPTRLRIEAAIALARQGEPRGIAVLIETLDACDEELTMRALDAMGQAAASVPGEFWLRLASDDGRAFQVRRAALQGLARAGRVQALLAVLAAESSFEMRDAVYGALAQVGDERARAALLRALEHLPAADLPSEALEFERTSLFGACAECDAASAALESVWLEQATRAAREDFAARCAARAMPAATFRWGGELALARSFARTKRLASALERCGAWWTLDARLLARLGFEAASDDADSARELFAAAWIARLGEAPTGDAEELDFDLARGLLELAESRGDWAAVARRTRALLRSWRALRVPSRLFEAAFGSFDPQRGVDPRSRLESAAWQAQAWSELESGRLEQAHASAARAARCVGRSQRAVRAQERLVRALQERAR